MRWIMRLLGWHPPDRTPTPIVHRDPDYDIAHEAYQADKQAAVTKQAEILARLKRIGYDFDMVTQRDRSGSH